MSESNEPLTEPKLERRTRRRLSAAETQRLLVEANALLHGGQEALAIAQGDLAAFLQCLREFGLNMKHVDKGHRVPSCKITVSYDGA